MPHEIIGREIELAAVNHMLDRAREELSILLFQGEAGIGKTTLWEAARSAARERGFEVLSSRPAQPESGLPLCGFGDLFSGVSPEVLKELPDPQRRALDVALLQAQPTCVPADQRAVSVATASLITALADRGPVLIAIDDVQWLDDSSAAMLAFAIRRVAEDPVGIVLSLRGSSEAQGRLGAETAVAPERFVRLTVGPLPLAAMHRLFVARLGQSFSRPVLVRIEQASVGNPFYALEIARELITGGVPSSGEPLPIPEDHRDLALLRLRRLPQATRDALLVVAALGRPSTADLDAEALEAAAGAGILRADPDGRVSFVHPLFASALYSSVPMAQRRRVHRELAARADTLEERARHEALAADGPDERTAQLLDEAAAAAGARGATPLAIELKELARRLTPPQDRAAVVRRDLELADRRYFAGDAEGARRELEGSLASLPRGSDRAQVLLELGSVIWTQGEVAGLKLLDQALDEADTPALRARIHSRASALAEDCDVALEHAQAALALVHAGEDPLVYSFALHNMAMWKLYAGAGADHEAIRRGVELQQEAASWEVSTVPAYWARCFDDFDSARTLFEDLLRVFREQGDEASSCGVMAQVALIDAMTGHMAGALALASEALDLAEQTGQETYVHVALHAKGQVCVRTGDLEGAREAGEAILDGLRDKPDLTLEIMARAVLGAAALAGDDPAEAARQLSRVDEIEVSLHEREPAATRHHADHAEAIIALGDLDRAEELVERMERRAEAVPRPWICAVSARSRGLLCSARGDLDGALAGFKRALKAQESLEMPLELGRTLLALGRLHRRRKEKRLADERLREAMAIFEEVGSPIWAERTRTELGRVGLRPRAPLDLTGTERRVAELAAEGKTNREVADAAFLSPKTVGNVLGRVYRKLGITSRAELGAVMAGRGAGRSAPGDP
jgi:DNA-binding CsgD family transcriptional regulator